MSMTPAEVSRIALSTTVAGEAMLLVGRAMVWPERRALIVADPHIGKAATFRASGLPVPHGTTFETLGRMSALIEAFDIEIMYVLGDFLHSRQIGRASCRERV